MDELRLHGVYDVRLGGRGHPVIKGIYLGKNNRQQRFLVRTGDNDQRDSHNTPRVYHFQQHEVDKGTLIIRYPRLANRLSSSELEFTEKLLNSKGIRGA